MIKPDRLSNRRIRKDNPHFGPRIRVIEDVSPCDGKSEMFTHYFTVGAQKSEVKGLCGTIFVDAWATYLWSRYRKCWVLGQN